jgi:hypothetical protein
MKWALASSIVRGFVAWLSMVVYVVAHSVEHAGSLIAESGT